MLFRSLVNNHQAKELFFFTQIVFFITLSLNLPRSLWFDLGTPRIILLRSPTLGSEQARSSKKHGKMASSNLTVHKARIALIVVVIG